MKKKRLTKVGKTALQVIADEIGRGVYGSTDSEIRIRLKNTLVERCNYAASGHKIIPHSPIDIIMMEWQRGVFYDIYDTIDAVMKAVM